MIKHLILLQFQNMMDIKKQWVLLPWSGNFLKKKKKKKSGSGDKHENILNKQLA